MKKRIMLYVVVYACLLIIAFNIGRSFGKEVPEFEIVYSMKSSFDNYETTDISVIVNVKKYDTEEMFNKVRNYYCELNREPNELNIKLYNSEKDFKTGKCYASREFEKEL